MEIKRTPYRVIILTREDCSDVQDAIGYTMKQLDKEVSEAIAAKDQVLTNSLIRLRSTLHSLLVAAIEI
jgi:hypothetical protein